jgi:hypothetical protein
VSVVFALGVFPALASGHNYDGGGAQAPTGPSGSTGTSGSSGTTGTTGTTGSTGSTGTLAPITLGRGQSPTAVYTGPVYEQTATGIILYQPAVTTSDTVDGGAKASGVASGPKFPELLVPGNTAERVHGLAAAPENAPLSVKEIIWAANHIIGRPYVYGGGHASFYSFGYDCSGTVSFALHGAKLLRAPLDSGQFERWGKAGQGRWMTILTNAGHAYLDIAGLRLDTSTENDPSGLQGPRWRPLRPANSGFVERHPAGL